VNRLLGISILLSLFVGATGPAVAQNPDWRFGGRALYLASATNSEEVGDTGNRLDMKSGLGLEFVASALLSQRFTAEFSIGASAHRLDLTGGECCDIDGGRVWLVPLNAIAQYHIEVYGHWDPYVGLGLTWIIPIYKVSKDLNEAGFEEVDFEGGAALAAQIGVNYQVDNRWYVNLDLRYLGASLEARLSTVEEDFPPVTLDINPFVFGLGCGYRF
jgi:outer membrane protein